MKRLQVLEDEPSHPELLRALVSASEELLPFAVICCGDPMRAEAYLQDVLVLSLESGWFCRAVDNRELFTHKEFREDIIGLIWKKVKEDSLKGVIAGIRTYGESSAGYYRLDLLDRATLYLRQRMKLSYEAIANILEEDSEDIIIARVHQAREQILGRSIAEGKEYDDQDA